MVDPPFFSMRLPGAYNSYSSPAIREDHEKEARSRQTHHFVSPFIRRGMQGITEETSIRVIKHILRLLKANPMFNPIDEGLAFMPFKLHIQYVR
jgi:hypothetical protein